MAAENTQRLYEELKKWGCNIEEGRERFLHDDELYERCLRRFPSDRGFTALEKAIEDGSLKLIYDSVHTVKGSCSTLNLDPIYRLSREITDRIEKGEQENLDQDLSRLLVLRDEYEEIIRRIEPDSKRPEDKTDDRPGPGLR